MSIVIQSTVKRIENKLKKSTMYTIQKKINYDNIMIKERIKASKNKRNSYPRSSHYSLVGEEVEDELIVVSIASNTKAIAYAPGSG